MLKAEIQRTYRQKICKSQDFADRPLPVFQVFPRVDNIGALFKNFATSPSSELALITMHDKSV